MSFLKTLFGLARDILWLVIRRKKQLDDPANQYEQAKSDNAEAVTRGDADAVNARMQRNLDRLRNDKDAGSGH